MRAKASAFALVGLFALIHAMAVIDIEKGTEVTPNNDAVLKVPEGTPDGVYNLWIDDITSGLVVDKLSDLLEDMDLFPHLRPRDKYVCKPVTLVSNNIERAAYNLGQTCGECSSVSADRCEMTHILSRFRCGGPETGSPNRRFGLCGGLCM